MLSLIIFIILVAAASLIGAQFGPDAWYLELEKPAWTPPNWLFAPVWIVLYIGIAVAGWLVWRARNAGSSTALVLWTVQLLLNGLWSWLFFGLRRPDLAVADITALLIVICCFIVTSINISHYAAWLFVPYALWVGFATMLNFAIWWLNPVFSN